MASSSSSSSPPPTFFLLFLSILTATSTSTAAAAASPYLSPTTVFQNYQNMLSTFRIYIYTPQNNRPGPTSFPTQPFNLFYSSLLNCPSVTGNPNEAHLFFLPFSPSSPRRSIGRLVREIRTVYPYWNRTLGADHFFISPEGIDFTSDRNLVELKKNAVQISAFPTTSGNFIPHKDITLPPFNPSNRHAPVNSITTTSFLGRFRWDGRTESDLVNALKMDADFLVESEPSDDKTSKFCLFFYGGGDVAGISEAMASGCVPVVIVDRWIQDMPLMDVLRWSELALLVGTRGGARGLKEVLLGVEKEKYERMRESCVEASRHLRWNAEPQPLDAFQMVMYQLWSRRHVIRYSRREVA